MPIADFFHTPTVDEVAKDSKRTVNKAQRDIARDQRQLAVEEQQITARLKEAARRGGGGSGEQHDEDGEGL